MFETLRTLHGLMSGRPKLARSEGVQVAVCGRHVVQFASDEDAAFFVTAYDAVPALLNVLDTLERRNEALGQGALEEAQAQLAVVRKDNERLRATVADLEKRLTVEIERRTEYAQRARIALRAQARVAALAKHAAELQATLDAERGAR